MTEFSDKISLLKNFVLLQLNLKVEYLLLNVLIGDGLKILKRKILYNNGGTLSINIKLIGF